MAAASIAPSQTDEAPAIITGSDSGNSGRPEFARSVLTPDDLSLNLGVISINAGLAFATLLLLVLSSELFNKTVEENHYTLARWFKPAWSPFAGFWGALSEGWQKSAGNSWLSVLAPAIAVLGLAALIYGVLEPGFGFNEKSLVMIIAIVATVGIVTYWYNGGQIIVSQGLFRMDAAIKLFPIGVLIAGVCVLFSRLDGFQPGIIYGFIASAVVVGSIEPNREQNGKIIFFPALALLALCVVAWLLISPFRDLANDHSSLWAAVPESVAVGVFVGALESTFFQMIPIRYLDGHKIWSWNKAAWVVVAGTTAFLFWDVLLRDQSSSMSSITKATPIAAIIAMVACFLLSVCFYAFFRLRGPDIAPEAEAA